jgi:hypothetical protein
VFKVGDEVTRVGEGIFVSSHTGEEILGPIFGEVYVVESVLMAYDEPAITLVGISMPWFGGFRASRFRKVQRKSTDLSIESFLTIKPGFEEPRKVTAPVREKA